MQAVELKISLKDWLYIGVIGALFGLLFSLCFYFLNDDFRDISTVFFGTFTALCITAFSYIFISVSNEYILPQINEKFWYIVSFGFSFLSGAIGFLFSFSLFYIFDSYITNLVEPYSLYLTFIIGTLTFLIGLILHQFISQKYKTEKIENEILQSKIKTLENELNPHFLFNALNSMCELVYIDQEKAENSILNLSKFLRNAISKESIISITDELSMVQTYVDIENIRFDNNIKLSVDTENTTNLYLPKFSIQLLVENAIKHGYMGVPLDIIIQVSEDKVVVSNNGKKIDKIKLGTGLSNLQNRLKLMKIGTLEYDETQTKNVQFIIKIGK